MATMDPRLILQASQGVDVLGAMSRGNALARDEMDMQRQNALAGYYRTNADGLLAGDQNALAGLMGHDPAAALGIQRQRQEDAWRQDDRQYRRDRDARQDERADQEWQFKLDQQLRAMNAEQLAQQKELYRVGFQAASAAQTPQDWDDTAMQFGVPELVGQFHRKDKILRSLMPMGEYIEQYVSPPKPLSGPGKVNADIIAGLLPEGTPLHGSGVTVNNRTDPAPATGYRNVYDEEGRLVSQEPIPGGPADLEGQQAQAKQKAEAAREMGRAQQMLTTIDSVSSDPALDSATGWMQWRQKLPGSGAKRFATKAAQLQGQVFLEGYQMLKGAGAITDYEGGKAEAAMARLDTAQSPEDYREALKELREVVETGMKRLGGDSEAGGAPDGIDPEIWDVMTEDERALFQ